MKLYNKCKHCGTILPIDELHHIGLRWWLCAPCDERWSYEEQQYALSAADNRCWFHNVHSCEDCYPEIYIYADGRPVPSVIAASYLLEQEYDPDARLEAHFTPDNAAELRAPVRHPERANYDQG